jgi:hypothetical protein
VANKIERKARRRPRFYSRIAFRIFAFNALLAFLPVAAFLLLDTYERGLLSSLEHALAQQARVTAAWLGQTAVVGIKTASTGVKNKARLTRSLSEKPSPSTGIRLGRCSPPSATDEQLGSASSTPRGGCWRTVPTASIQSLLPQCPRRVYSRSTEPQRKSFPLRRARSKRKTANLSCTVCSRHPTEYGSDSSRRRARHFPLRITTRRPARSSSVQR